MTAIVPTPSASGTLRPGSRISSAMYAAAFHPEYVNITGISARSQPPRGDRARRLLEVRARARADREADRDEDEQRRDLQRREGVADEPARADAADVDAGEQPDRDNRHERLARERERHERDRHDEERRRVRDARYEPIEIEHEDDRARRHRPGEAGHERRPPGQERGQPAVRRTQIDVLATRARPQRRQLRVRHRARERERAAERPHREEPPRVRDHRGHLRRREENPAADDVGHDNRGGVERTKPAIEDVGRRRVAEDGVAEDGAGVGTGSRTSRGTRMSGPLVREKRRGIFRRWSSTHWAELCFAKIWTFMSRKWLFFNISARDLRRIAGVAELGSHGDGVGLVAVERHALHEHVVEVFRRRLRL